MIKKMIYVVVASFLGVSQPIAAQEVETVAEGLNQSDGRFSATGG